MDDSAFLASLTAAHAAHPARLSAARAAGWLDRLLAVLVPERAAETLPDVGAVAAGLAGLTTELTRLLTDVVIDPLTARPDQPTPAVLAAAFAATLPATRAALLADAAFLASIDPAAADAAEVVGVYPGFYATAIYRIAHALHTLGVSRLPRILTEVAHSRTGIDLHPAARIASPFGIDHGTGVVVGTTAIIGRAVLLYQGVTLGAVHVEKALAGQKRHPTIEDHVVIYAGATILGGATVVGARSIIGGNVWLTRSVPAYSRVYHQAQVEVRGAVGPVEGLMCMRFKR